MEADLGMLLGVEEVRRGQVRVALLIAGIDARDLDVAVQDRRVAGRVKRACERVKRAADGRDPHVADLEADVRVGWVDVVGPDRDQVREGCG